MSDDIKKVIDPDISIEKLQEEIQVLKEEKSVVEDGLKKAQENQHTPENVNYMGDLQKQIRDISLHVLFLQKQFNEIKEVKNDVKKQSKSGSRKKPDKSANGTSEPDGNGWESI